MPQVPTTVHEFSTSGVVVSARAAQGTVVAREPNNHATVRAVYQVDGVTYTVADQRIGPPNPTFDAVRVGDTVTVYYDPALPGRAVLSQPQTRRSDAFGFAILAALSLATLFMIGAGATFALWARVLRPLVRRVFVDRSRSRSGRDPLLK